MTSQTGTSDPEFLMGDDGNDDLHGLGGDDVLYGLGGNDILEGGDGGDYMHGGDGNDTVDYRNSPASVWVDLSNGFAAGGDGFGDTLVSIENVIGSSEQDLIIGDGNMNGLSGGGGNDVIEGRDFNDILQGGAGGDVLDGGDGIDYADYSNSAAVVINLEKGVAAGGEAFGDTLISIEAVFGSQQQDWIVGDESTLHFNSLSGNGGNDLIQGLGGIDSLYGQEGDDVLDGGDGNDALLGGPGADQLDGGNDIDQAHYAFETSAIAVNLETGVNGGAAQGDTLMRIEKVLGTAFADSITGDAANNYLEGYAGLDTLIGGVGNDTLIGGVSLDGGTGNDQMFIDIADGGAANGGGGRDQIFGAGGKDVLNGATGNDILIGLTGADGLTGGAGADTFEYRSIFDSKAGAKQDLIRDFRHAEADRISLEQLDPIPGGGDDAMKFIGKASFTGHAGEVRYANNLNQNFTAVQIDIDGDRHADMQIRLTGVIAMTAGDFIL